MSSSRILNLEQKALLIVLVLVAGQTPSCQAHAAWARQLAVHVPRGRNNSECLLRALHGVARLHHVDLAQRREVDVVEARRWWVDRGGRSSSTSLLGTLPGSVSRAAAVEAFQRIPAINGVVPSGQTSEAFTSQTHLKIFAVQMAEP
jgi:hypothetical protein